MLLFYSLVMAFVVGQCFPLFKIQVVEASGSGVGISVLAVAPQRMQRQMQRARHCLHGDDRFGWELAKRGKQRFADQLAHERGRAHGGGLVHEMSQRSAQVLFVEADRQDTACRSGDRCRGGSKEGGDATCCTCPDRPSQRAQARSGRRRGGCMRLATVLCSVFGAKRRRG
ncbi:hypothetical protein XANMN_02345 [Xanthomonas phaseoli pv. manihotis str. CIO151]|nr:hypothetical protein XANMN_02345 [Xanthomonas phaseoli pv. manihotis str. CIO151]